MSTTPSTILLGAIAGDVLGSVYEWHNTKRTDINLFDPRCDFTDDTVMSIAVARWLTSDPTRHPHTLTATMKDLGHRYFDRGYGARFFRWLHDSRSLPYNSWGNGSAMRVSGAGAAAATLEEALLTAETSAAVTHNHPEGIKGAQATAAAIFLARTGSSKKDIRQYVESTFGYDLHHTCDELRPGYQFDVSCQGSVPQALIAFLDSTDYEQCIRLAISLGGDSDTIACMAGGVAAACYGTMPQDIVSFVLRRLPQEFRQAMQEFDSLFGPRP